MRCSKTLVLVKSNKVFSFSCPINHSLMDGPALNPKSEFIRAARLDKSTSTPRTDKQPKSITPGNVFMYADCE